MLDTKEAYSSQSGYSEYDDQYGLAIIKINFMTVID